MLAPSPCLARSVLLTNPTEFDRLKHPTEGPSPVDFTEARNRDPGYWIVAPEGTRWKVVRGCYVLAQPRSRPLCSGTPGFRGRVEFVMYPGDIDLRSC